MSRGENRKTTLTTTAKLYGIFTIMGDGKVNVGNFSVKVFSVARQHKVGGGKVNVSIFHVKAFWSVTETQTGWALQRPVKKRIRKTILEKGFLRTMSRKCFLRIIFKKCFSRMFLEKGFWRGP